MFEPKRRVYQRLLAGDQEEATEVIDAELENRPLVEVYDTLLIPALALAETDWHRGELDEARHKFILQSLKEMIHERDEDQQETPAKEGEAKEAIVASEGGQRPRILCLPARDEADEIAAMMLAQLLATRSTGCLGECLVQSVSFTATANEVVDLLATAHTRCRLHFRHASRRRDACPPPVQARSRPISASTRGRGIVGRTRRLEQSASCASEPARDACRGDVGGGSIAGPPADPAALAAGRERAVAGWRSSARPGIMSIVQTAPFTDLD